MSELRKYVLLLFVRAAKICSANLLLSHSLTMLVSAGVRTESLCPVNENGGNLIFVVKFLIKNVISNQEYQKRATLKFEISLHFHSIRLHMVIITETILNNLKMVFFLTVLLLCNEVASFIQITITLIGFSHMYESKILY